jgi:hypothetical protein
VGDEEGETGVEDSVAKKTRHESDGALGDCSRVPERQSAEYLLRLKAEAGLTQVAVDKVIDATGSLIADVVVALKEKVLNELAVADGPVERSDVAKILEKCSPQDPLADLCTVRQQKNYVICQISSGGNV